MGIIDVARYLTTRTVIEGHLRLCSQDLDPGVFLLGLHDALRAKQMHSIKNQVKVDAQKAQSLLHPEQNPSTPTVYKFLTALHPYLKFAHRSCLPKAKNKLPAKHLFS